jgi:acetyl esterase/lipase
VMKSWAQAGFVAVNIEYHGYSDGLYGNLTYPGPQRWGDSADATVQLDIKPAMAFFLSHNPQLYGADERAGIVVFGGSSGAHNAYMVGLTGVTGHRITAVVGWSGLPDVADSGSYPQSVFDRYMRTEPGSDVEKFGDPAHRLRSGVPPQYVADGLHEFISPLNADRYTADCRAMGDTCWERIPNTTAHAQGYSGYTFTGQSPESSDPGAVAGNTVLQDSIAFARSQLPTRD